LIQLGWRRGALFTGTPPISCPIGSGQLGSTQTTIVDFNQTLHGAELFLKIGEAVLELGIFPLGSRHFFLNGGKLGTDSLPSSRATGGTQTASGWAWIICFIGGVRIDSRQPETT